MLLEFKEVQLNENEALVNCPKIKEKGLYYVKNADHTFSIVVRPHTDRQPFQLIQLSAAAIETIEDGRISVSEGSEFLGGEENYQQVVQYIDPEFVLKFAEILTRK